MYGTYTCQWHEGLYRNLESRAQMPRGELRYQFHLKEKIMNRVEKRLSENTEHGLPVPGMEVEYGRTAVVITDPQNDFLHPDGVAWGVCGESATENNTIANLQNLMETAVSIRMPLVISPHY